MFSRSVLRAVRPLQSRMYSVPYVTTVPELTKLVNAPTLTIVDFTAAWCGPCKQIAPVLDKLAEQNTNVTFVKVDVDDALEVAAEYGIAAMPTFKVFKNGEQLETIIGANVKRLTEVTAEFQ